MGAAPTSRARVVLAVHRAVLRTGRTPIGRIWPLAHRLIARAVLAYVIRREPAAGYLRGSVGTGDFVPGLSDIDLVVVAGTLGDTGARARRRRDRLAATARLLVDGPMVYEETDLRDLAGTSALTYGLDGTGGPALHDAAYFGEHADFDWLRMLERPGLHGADADWRLISGRDRRPREPAPDRHRRRIAAWLELTYLWRWAFPLCVDSSGPRASNLCVKLVAESARIWLFLAHGELATGRQDALRRALSRLPEEEQALRRSLELHAALARSPDPPLDEAISALLRFSQRVARLIGDEVAQESTTMVRLAGADPPELILPDGGSRAGLLPLADWRALACPLPPDESLARVSGDPGDPAVLAQAAAVRGPYPALQTDDLMLLPAAPWWRTRLRAIQCRVTDPVSFALLGGERTASFPDMPGWSARDVALRAVAEHRAWLRGEPGRWASSAVAQGLGGELAMLFTGARAALFLESLGDGDPELPLTVTETARRLSSRSATAATVVAEALEQYREFALRRGRPAAATVLALRREIAGLPAYAEVAAGSVARAAR